jgi:hypothetical protein
MLANGNPGAWSQKSRPICLFRFVSVAFTKNLEHHGGTANAPNAVTRSRRSRRSYFSSTVSICPTFFSTLPRLCSALPLASKVGLFVILPVVSLTTPFI